MPVINKNDIKMKFGKQVRNFQRNFPYPIKNLIKKVESLETSSDGLTIVILAQRKTFIEALWTAYSWIYFLGSSFSLLILMDGAPNVIEKRVFSKIFPNGILGDREDYIDRDVLNNRYLNEFYQYHKFGKVLALKISLQRHRDIIFSDPDVLVFQKPIEILEHVQSRQGFFFSEPNANSVSDWVADRASELSLKITRNFNSGVLFIPQGSLSLDLCFSLIEGWSRDIHDYFPEQTICDVLMTESGAIALPEDQYIVSNAGMWYWDKDIDYHHVKIRHFVGNVRHRMYINGYPIIRNSIIN